MLKSNFWFRNTHLTSEVVVNIKDKWVIESSHRTIHATGMYIHLKIKKYGAHFSLLFSVRQIYTIETLWILWCLYIFSTISHDNSIIIFHICIVIKYLYVQFHLIHKNAFKYINVLLHKPLNTYIKQNDLSQKWYLS